MQESRVRLPRLSPGPRLVSTAGLYRHLSLGHPRRVRAKVKLSYTLLFVPGTCALSSSFLPHLVR